MGPDPDKVAEIMCEIAQDELLPRHKMLAKGDVWEKERGGTVTIADLESERRLKQALVDLAPGSLVLGEEDSEENPHTHEYLNEDTPVWIVDPLDGTKNFAAGKEQYAMIVAFYDKGAVRAGWILSPSTGHMAMAEEGSGAWGNGNPPKDRARRPPSLNRQGFSATVFEGMKASRFSLAIWSIIAAAASNMSPSPVAICISPITAA